MILLFFMICIATMTGHPAHAEETCQECHQQTQPELIHAWQQSRHAQANVGCTACHGSIHDHTMAAYARTNQTCLACHAEAGKSYLLSKHGVIATLEADRMNLTLPLKEGNIRAPTCAYCHLHQNNHAGNTHQERATPCRDCHSSRFVDTWFTTGSNNLEIAAKKQRESEKIFNEWPNNRHDTAKNPLEQLKSSLENHLLNVRLGVGHQSPDDLWWHGQPALDGDLLRLKSMRSQMQHRPLP
ncbi:MAG: hypothetical protein G8237_07035 [Magnetococcales bacterium]|nr:hypothetical protein [Magnetococcales bacterium]NGZ06096.1 hypothetical protein [Magnetococcales bacterium]